MIHLDTERLFGLAAGDSPSKLERAHLEQCRQCTREVQLNQMLSSLRPQQVDLVQKSVAAFTRAHAARTRTRRLAVALATLLGVFVLPLVGLGTLVVQALAGFELFVAFLGDGVPALAAAASLSSSVPAVPIAFFVMLAATLAGCAVGLRRLAIVTVK
jgi:hypothetical protein